MTDSPKRRSPWFWIALGGAVLAVVLVVGGPRDDGPPLDPEGVGDLGTRALVLLIEGLGGEVDVTDRPPDANHDVALVLADDLDDRGRRALAGWVQAGGTLVVADPASPLAGFAPSGPANLGPIQSTIANDCDVAALAGVGRVDPAGGVVYDATGGDGCFSRGGGSFVVVGAEGAGTVVAVGGAATFVNSVIGEADNAALAAALLVPRTGTRVAFLQPPAPGSSTEGDGLLELVSPNVEQAVWQLAIAFGVYAWWRARRLGRPVLERQPVELAGSELVVAVGHLLQQAHRRDQAGALLGDDLRRQLADRLGLGPAATAEQVAEVAAARTGVDAGRVLTAIRPGTMAGDDDLVAHARAVDTVRQEVNHVG